MDCRIYGAIYWLSQLKKGKCIASNKTIAQIAGSPSSGVIRNSVIRLHRKKYIQCVYQDDKKNKVRNYSFNHNEKRENNEERV